MESANNPDFRTAAECADERRHQGVRELIEGWKTTGSARYFLEASQTTHGSRMGRDERMGQWH
eukprot:6212471-Pleurochrysis_carterae.AAC.7